MMRLTLPSLLLLLTLPGWSLAQERSDEVPRPEARPDEAAESTEALDPAPARETMSPASVNEANSRAAGDAEDTEDEPSESRSPEADEAAESSTVAPSKITETPAPAEEPVSSASGSSGNDIAPDEPPTRRSADTVEDTSKPTDQSASEAVEPDTVPLPEARPEEAEPARSAPPPSPDASSSDAPSPRDALPSPSQATLKSVTPAASVRAAAALLASESCEERLTELGVTFETGKSINTGSCGVLRPLSVSELSSGIAVRTETQMWCPVADALETWVTSAVEPAAEKHFPDRTFAGISRISTYVCRNRGSGEKISEHARGAAIDIGAFVFEDGEVPVSEADPLSPEGKFLKDVREAACGPFTTVLGPGTDADHAKHFHFDLAARSNGPYCR
ncbi:extensin family protein [Fulvimarina sp. MAC8]|uniref:extensin family protein n=1 Tax=Fulvimarina sp. MAC8 TaxID=3162874 RepID=UPI0032ECB588